ncbi:TolC family protein [Engelhardtia mirabilis]|uniref:Outer membrane efflux protein n=1 Tax=Engelhardtia mirabilis TaxID=2528011 RepID=A0A518BQC4_9BACT|nr:Outer membrane efflux protein [Planctomycetes bacterium Pla133]QDV03485.1 Outer membrane efflux protein [Planctomycetes bacterium Pla86]
MTRNAITRATRHTRIAVLLPALAACASAPRSVPGPAPEQVPIRSTRAPAVAPPAAEEFDPASATLDDYVRYALGHDPGLLAELERADAARERVGSAAQPPDPKLMVTEFVEQIQTRTGPNRRRVELTQPWPWFGTLDAREALADRTASWTESSARARAARTVERVERAYHEYAFGAVVARLLEEKVVLLENLASVVQWRVEAGAPQEDWLRLEIEVAELEARAQAAREQLVSQRIALSAAVGWWGEIPPPEAVEPAAMELDHAALEAMAMDRSPALRTAAAGLERARAQGHLADFAGRPDLAFSLVWLDVGDALDPAQPGSGDDPIGLGVSIGLPLWRGSYSAQRRAAEHEIRAARYAIDDRRAELSTELADILYRLESAGRDLELARDQLLPRAREAYDLGLASYQSGEGSLLDLFESERRVLGYEVDRWRAARDVHIQRARLQALTGSDQP